MHGSFGQSLIEYRMLPLTQYGEMAWACRDTSQQALRTSASIGALRACACSGNSSTTAVALTQNRTVVTLIKRPAHLCTTATR